MKISLGTRNALLSALAAGITTGEIRIYGGTPPADADADATGNTTLCVVSVNGAGTALTFSAPSGGTMVKTPAEAWLGTNLLSGTATFYRLVNTSDDDLVTTTLPRVQGTVGLINADLNLATTSLLVGQEQRIDTFVLGMPGE